MRIFAQEIILPGGYSDNGTWKQGSNVLSGPEGFRITSLADLIGTIIPYFILFAGIGMLLMLIAGGFQLLMGGSDPKQIEMGKKRITYSIVGFIVVFIAYWLVQAFTIIFGLSEFACVFGSVGGVTCNQ